MRFASLVCQYASVQFFSWPSYQALVLCQLPSYPHQSFVLLWEAVCSGSAFHQKYSLLWRFLRSSHRLSARIHCSCTPQIVSTLASIRFTAVKSWVRKSDDLGLRYFWSANPRWTSKWLVSATARSTFGLSCLDSRVYEAEASGWMHSAHLHRSNGRSTCWKWAARSFSKDFVSMGRCCHLFGTLVLPMKVSACFLLVSRTSSVSCRLQTKIFLSWGYDRSSLKFCSMTCAPLKVFLYSQ